MRYPIALLGERGLLTSDSTRIDGLVSVTDVATGRLRVVENDDPAQALEELDDRIERNDRLATAADDRARRAPDRARARAPALRAAGAARRARRQPLAEPAHRGRRRRRRAAPAARLGLRGDPARLPRLDGARSRDGRALAVRPLPVRPLLRDQQPARDDAARPGARSAPHCSGARGSSSPRSPSSRSAATASAPTAAASSCSRSPTSSSGCGSAASDRPGAWPGWSRRARSRSRSRCSASTRRPVARATSRTRSATARRALAGDIADRIELSVRRTAASLGATAVVLGSLAILIAVALRARRSPVLDAFLVAIAVSLVVNDTPGDVLGMGAAIAIALARYTPEQGWLSSGPMRRAAALLALLACSARSRRVRRRRGGLADARDDRGHAPGGDDRRGAVDPARVERSRATPRTARRSSPRPAAAAATRSRRPGSTRQRRPQPRRREARLGARGRPRHERPGRDAVVRDSLSEQEIADVAAYVSESTR